MNDVLFALLAIGAGAVFCFRGQLAFRVVIPVWGAFVGFGFGAGLVSSLGDDRFLGTAMGWMAGLAFAVVFAALAYLFYEVAVVLAMGSIGFALGASAMVAVGASWTWAIILVGLGLGLLLAYTAIVSDLPLVLLVVLSAFAGASAITTGVMLLFDTISTDEFRDRAVTSGAGDWWVLLTYFGLVIAGVIAQTRAAGRASGSMRDSWDTRKQPVG